MDNKESNCAVEYTDVFEMIKDIKDYAAANGNQIVNQDKPRELKLGFKCEATNKQWTIRIKHIRCVEADGPSLKIIKNAFCTENGRNLFCDYLNNKTTLENLLL